MKIGSLPKLESLVVTVNEWRFLQMLIEESDSPLRWHESLSAGPQIHLHMLRAPGMAGLRSLRNLKYVKFALPQHPRLRRKHTKRGSIRGGLLETTVRPEMMQSGRADAGVLVNGQVH